MCGGGAAKMVMPESAKIQAAWGKSMRARGNSDGYTANEAALDAESKIDRTEYLEGRSGADMALVSKDVHKLAVVDGDELAQATEQLANSGAKLSNTNKIAAEGIKAEGTNNRLSRTVDAGSKVAEGMTHATNMSMSTAKANAQAETTVNAGKSAMIGSIASGAVQMYGAEQAFQSSLKEGEVATDELRKNYFAAMNPYLRK